jgi:hypothetical protein
MLYVALLRSFYVLRCKYSMLSDENMRSLSFSIAFARRSDDFCDDQIMAINNADNYSPTVESRQRYVVCVKDSQNSWNAFKVWFYI